MTLSDLCFRTFTRLNENTSTPVYYTQQEAIDALNEGQRFFVLMTLCLETTAAFTVQPATALYHMLATFPDWLLPLRVYFGNDDVRPSTMELLSAYDPGWGAVVGGPEKYVSEGLDFFAVYPQPAASATLEVTYARAPVALALGSDVPEIPEPYHPALVDYATYKLRFKEGGQEFEKGMVYLSRFLDDARKLAEYVRARNLGMRYDAVPFELRMADKSRVLKVRKDLAPNTPKE